MPWPLTHQVAPSAFCPNRPAQLVSTQAWWAVHRRMTTPLCPPQVGQKAMSGAGWWRRGVSRPRGRPCKISRRRVAQEIAPLACSKPQCRTFMQPAGRTCGRPLRRNAMTSRVVVRGRALPGLREVQMTGWSLRATRRLLARATLKTEGARDVQAGWPWPPACEWTVPGRLQPCGALGSGNPAWRMSSLQRAREMGESAVTGTQQWSLEGCQVGRSCERLLPQARLTFFPGSATSGS